MLPATGLVGEQFQKTSRTHVVLPHFVSRLYYQLIKENVVHSFMCNLAGAFMHRNMQVNDNFPAPFLKLISASLRSYNWLQLLSFQTAMIPAMSDASRARQTVCAWPFLRGHDAVVCINQVALWSPGAFAVALLFGSLGVVASLFWICGAAIASTLGIFIFAPWLVLAATLTAVSVEPNA